MTRRLARTLAVALFAFAARAAVAQNDLSVTAITQPVSGCALTATESVTIKVFNFGNTLPAATSFNVSYTVNAGAPVTELVVLGSPLLSNSTLTYTFTTQANLSVPGSYTFNATASLAGDVNPTNDALTGVVVANTAPSAGGTLAGGTGSCPTVASGVLTLSGQTGSVVRWETSTDGGATWVNISNTTTTQSFSNVPVPTSYRVLVQNGTCAPQHSSIASVSPSIASPVITAPADVCPRSTGNVASVADAGPGAIYSWGITGGTITSGAGTRSIVFTATGTVSLTASVQSAAGCTGSAGATVSLRTSTVSIVLHGAACVGATGLRADIVPGLGDGAIYFWTISNGLITAGLGTHSITYQPTGSSDVVLEALVAQSGCLQDVLATVPLSVCTTPGAFHPLPPCRAVDTRSAAGPLWAPALAPGESRVLLLFLASCGFPANAKALAVNVTTISSGTGALALGPGDAPPPAIEMLPLVAGKTRAVQSIVRLATDASGRIVVFNDSTGSVDLVLDVSGWFE